jgi:hypothetical protein
MVLLPIGNETCRLVLDASRISVQKTVAGETHARAGRIIGNLERLLMFAGIVFDRWEVLAAVIALKSVTRYRDMDDKNFAEYFLIGSLFSILWTIAVAAVFLWFDAGYGANLQAAVILIRPPLP